MDGDEIEIPIKYQGLDADRHEIEIVALGQSLQGAGRLIKAAGGAVLPQQRSARLRVVTKNPNAACYEIIALLIVMQPVLPFLAPAAKTVIEAIVNHMIARLSNKPDASERMADLAKTALQENGMTARAAIETIFRVSENSRPAVRQFLAPIGNTCRTARIGHEENGAILFDQDDRDAIESDPVEIGSETAFELLITELDLQNGTCKFNFRDESENKRYAGVITDPALAMPNNPYSLALAQKQWLEVKGKPEIREGEMTRLHISNSG